MNPGPKKILILTHEFAPAHGGIARYATELATAAAHLGHEVTVLAPDYRTDMEAIDKPFPFTVRRYDGAVYGPTELPSLFMRTATMELQDYDLVHAVDPSFVMAMAFRKKFSQIDYQATVYGTDILGLRTSVQATLTGTRDMFERPTRLVAISEFTRQLLLEKCPRIPHERVAISPLGVHPFWFEPPSKSTDIPGLETDIRKNLLVTVARLDSRKGHRTVLKALRQLPDGLKESVTYAIVGSAADQSYHAELMTLASQSGCDVRFLGNLTDEQVRALYARATLFCMPGEPDPKKVEGFGLVYLEAAAQELPSIASNLGAAPEVVLDNRTGWLVEPANTQMLSTTIAKLLENSELVHVAGEQARQFASQFTWEQCARITYGEAR